MYLRRKMDATLDAWLSDEDRKPLIVKGPRQVGKTAAIRRFAMEHYESVVEINFVEEPKYKSITSDGYSVEEVVKNISLLDPSKRFIPGRTLIFFDELQDHPDIATSLKFFKQDGRFDVICSGSMLGINYQKIESNSVGYKTDVEMSLLDFEEFLWAKGYGSDVADGIFHHLVQVKPFSEFEMKVYTICSWTTAHRVACRRLLPCLLNTALLRARCSFSVSWCWIIRRIFRSMPRVWIVLEFLTCSSIFQCSWLKKTKNSRSAKWPVELDPRTTVVAWNGLESAGMVNVCRCLSFPELPLKGNYDENKYKIYFADTGLFVSMLDDEASDDLRANRNLGVYKGALFESIVGETLRKEGCGLYYYKRENSTLEEDFFVRTRNNLVSVEVKSKKGTAKSMRTLITSDSYPDIQFGIKLSAGNVGSSSKLFTAPYFTTFLLRQLLKAYDEGEAALFTEE